MNPKISIITPSYNQGQFIEATIQSVLNQTYANIEYILVDGGSTDETMDIVTRYKDRIDIVIHEKDKGQSDAINKGFRLATGDLVGWINSDDILYPDCVEKIVDLYRNNPGGAVYYGALCDWIDDKGMVYNQRRLVIPDRRYLLNTNYSIVQQSSFYPTSLVREVGYLDESIHYCMDLDLWLKLSARGAIYSTTEAPLSAFRLWGETKTQTGGQKFLSDIRRVLRRHRVSPLAPTLWKTQLFSFKLSLRQTLALR